MASNGVAKRLRRDKREFPVYSATQALLAHAEYRPSPKRMTLTEVTRQMAALKANLARIDMRHSKAIKANEHLRGAEGLNKILKLERLRDKSQAQFLSLSAEFIRLGGGVIKG